MVRFKNRYITIEVNPDDNSQPFPLRTFTLHSAIINSVEKLHGDFGSAAIRAGFTAKYCNEVTRIAIIRVRHGPHQLVTSALPFISTLGKNSVTIRTLYIGATLQHCYKVILRHQKAALMKILKDLKNPDEVTDMITKVMDLQAVKDFGKQPVKP